MVQKKHSVYEIDQSGKIEQTHRHTIVAIANGQIRTIKISAGEKIKLIKAMKELDFPKHIYIYKIFVCLIFLLIRDLKIKHVVIDREYPGHESIIKDVLVHLFIKNKLIEPYIAFGLVGKKSQAHISALATYQEKNKPDVIVKAKDVLEILYEANKKGRRSQSSRDNL